MTGAGGDPAKIPKLMINEESDKNIEYNHSPENVFSEQKESENSDDAKRTDLKIQPDNGMNAPTFILQGAQNQDFQSNAMILNDSGHDDFHADTMILEDKVKRQPDSGMNAPTFILQGAQNQDFQSNTMILNDSGHDDFQAKTMILEDSKSDDFQSNTMILNDSDNDGLQAHTLILAGNQKKKTIQSGLSGNTFILPETENIRIRELDLRKFSISNINPVKSHQTLVDSENGPGADSVFLPEAGAGSEQSQKSAESHDIQSMNSRSSGGNLKKQNFYGSKASLPSVGEIIGHYKIISELGRGGFGAVYYAQNMILGRDEALKLILPSARTEFKDTEMRFVREINIVARLEHPNIVRLYSSGHLASGMLWMTMELIRGERLDKKLQKNGAFSIEKGRSFMLQLLSALSEAHSRDIVHRDLKPANIMIQQKKGYDDLVVILDFGLSKAIGPSDDNLLQNLTQDSKQVYGTPQYMAPEQLNKGIIGPWTDVYSAGLIFYEILTAHPGFAGTTIFDIAYKQRHQSLIFPDHLKNTAVQDIINKACAKNMSDRYQNASEFYEDVFKLTDALCISKTNHSEDAITSYPETSFCNSLFHVICLFIVVTFLIMLIF